jgi:hypothetical protein
MHPAKLPFAIAGAVYAVLFAFAFVVAPHACEWGLTAYFWTGVVSVLAMGALPFVLPGDRTLAARIGVGLGLAIAGMGAWIGGIAAANVQILCRLF